MTALLLVLGGLGIFEVAALIWGADSREKLQSPEWERRQNWRGFH